ncbi:M20/M25/M40 family metallo-hydrolase [Sphingomonas prati]|uniref:Acetylornithine deacetylase/succinyl-diaminopimelate desuccinylase-like protein n=1 Tax=Sphingomonas prati TaxID=1843237 RepID=A0A7W9BUY6_9SPHN|nr:M20/M25/M40 family metallo-hydrolase [Sphingomonas prati]MBB5730589.1 acetylornithine deacetylase/succinyl-diaminopimelate desuccinylase-like protein [Sphingomonas prati]GGE95167.1 peptidase M20 [Sphingomonas prati]
MKRAPALLITAALAVQSLPAAAQTPPARPDRVAFRELYRELIETNTTSSVGNCTTAAEQIATRLRAAGFSDKELVLYVPPGRARDGGLVATWVGSDAKLPAMLLLAHIDVVEAKREDWVREPFKLIEEGGFFYARGTSDDKAQAAIFSDSLIRLRAAGYKPRRTIKLALTCGEEGSNPNVLNGARWLVENRPELLKAGFALNEGGGGRTAPGGGPETLGVQVSQKSPRNYILEVTNPGGHSSVPLPDNAIYRLAAAILKVGAVQFPVHLNPVSQAYLAKAGALRKDAVGTAMRTLAATPSDADAARALSADPAMNALLRTTCVATLLDGGHAANALPQRATAGINCRIVPGETPDETRATIAAAIADPQVKVLPSKIQERPVAVTPPLDPAILKPIETVGAKHFPGIPVIPTQSTGATDATYLSQIGVPTYGIPGLWNDGSSGTHGLNERMSADALYRGRDYIHDLIQTYAAG